MSPRGSTVQAVQDVRRTAASLAALCDTILYAPRWDAEQALQRLPEALRRLTITTARTVAALEAEGIP